MSLISLFSKFIQLQCLVAVAALLALSFSWWNQKSRGVEFRRELKFHYAVLAAILLSALFTSVFSSQDRFLRKGNARITVWAAATAKEWVAERGAQPPWIFSLNESASWKAPHDAPWAIILIGCAYVLYGLFLFGRDLYLTKIILRTAYRIRRLGRLEIMASSEVASPFSSTR